MQSIAGLVLTVGDVRPHARDRVSELPRLAREVSAVAVEDDDQVARPAVRVHVPDDGRPRWPSTRREEHDLTETDEGELIDCRGSVHEWEPIRFRFRLKGRGLERRSLAP